MGRFAFVLSLLAAGVLSPASASAQSCEPEPEPADSTRAAARQHYTRGVRASTAQRWDQALEAFQTAYATAAFAPVVYNLATAQAQTGMLVEAAENYRRFLRRCSSRDSPELRRDATDLLEQVEPRIGRLRIDAENFAAVDTLEVDGTALPAAVVAAEIPFNPGHHELRVVREGEGEIASESFDLREGGEYAVSLALPEYVAPVASGGGNGGGGGGGGEAGGGDDGPIIAGVTIAVILAVGAGVAIPLAIVFTSDQTTGPELVTGDFPAAQLPLVRF